MKVNAVRLLLRLANTEHISHALVLPDQICPVPIFLSLSLSLSTNHKSAAYAASTLRLACFLRIHELPTFWG